MNFTLEKTHQVDSFGELKGSISIVNGKILYSKEKQAVSFSLQDNYYLYPAFINIHDHLLGSYYPRVGAGNYLSWLPWDCDLKDSIVYKERALFTNEEIYLLGSLKNLISGAVFVQDHFPHHLNKSIIPQMPISIIKNYTLAHEVSSYDLKWGDPQQEHTLAKEMDWPFITHIAEGYDDESKKGISNLKKLGALDEHTVLVHGLQLSDEDIKDITSARSHLVWCPVSNYFMYNDTAPVNKWLEQGINVSLGTDSPASGGFNILDEMQKAQMLYKKFFGQELSSKLLFEMVTSNPAKALRMNVGNLKEGNEANIVLTKKVSHNIHKNISQLKLSDISLVIKGGAPIYGDKEFQPLFDLLKIKTTPILVEETDKILAHSPSIKLLKKIKTILKYDKYFPFLPIIVL
jgi:5-methylthioadenosine/S-adenosylhomocysteine deaminase